MKKRLSGLTPALYLMPLVLLGFAASLVQPASSQLGLGRWGLPFFGVVNYGGTAFGVINTGSGSGIYGQGNYVGTWGWGAGWGAVGQSSAGYGSWNSSDTGVGVYGQSNSNWGGLFISNGWALAGISGDGVGTYSQSTNNWAVYGFSNNSVGVGGISANNWAVYGQSTNSIGVGGVTNGNATGVYGHSVQRFGVYGYSEATHANGAGVLGFNNQGDGGWGGFFYGDLGGSQDLQISGTKSFKIDHPLDPTNKWLLHACVESDERMNVYSGVAFLDAEGKAWVELPNYFEALNRDFRYQLTAIGAPGPGLYIEQEVSGNRFRIAGGAPGMKVSWEVSGVRQDAYANAHPFRTEVEKVEGERGLYIHPVEHGVSERLGMKYQEAQRMKAELARMQKPPTAPALPGGKGPVRSTLNNGGIGALPNR